MNLKDRNDYEFEDNLETTIHEILHVLGFSGGAMKFWIDPSTGKPYTRDLIINKTIRGLKTPILTSKNVVEVTRKYYNCPTAEG